MQIRKRLHINVIVMILLSVAVCLVLSLSLIRVQKASRMTDLAGEIITGILERTTFSNDYLRTGNPRAKEQWYVRQGQIERLLDSLSRSSMSTVDRKSLSELIDNQKSVETIFAAIVSNKERVAPDPAAVAVSRHVEERLVNQLNVRGYGDVVHCRLLHASGDAVRDASIRQMGLGTTFSILVIFLVTIVNSLQMKTAITSRIGRLLNGTQMIGDGNLDHHIEISGDDELCDLSTAFNSMADKLSQSHRDLKTEIETRKLVETELRAAHDETERRVEERTVELMQAKDALRESNRKLEQRVLQRTDELRAANAALVDSRRAALNLMQDAIEARNQAMGTGIALHASEQRIQQALLVSRSFTFEWFPDTDRVRRSASCEPILKLSGDDITIDTGRNFIQSIHPDDRARFVQMLGGLSPSTNKYQTEYRVVCGDGSEVVLDEVGQGIFDTAGTLLRLVGVTTDITARKVAELALQKAYAELEQRVAERTAQLASAVEILQKEIDDRKMAEAELEKSAREIEDLYNYAPCGYHSLDEDGTFVRINDTELMWLGYQREEIVGRIKAAELMTPESRVVFAKSFPGFIRGNSISDLRLTFIRKDGSHIPVMLNATPIMASDGEFVMSRSTIYDITDLALAEDSVRRLNRLYLTLSETGKAIAHISDRAGLYREICRIVVEYGGFRMAWVGLVDAESGLVLPAASFGSDTDYLDNIRIQSRIGTEGMGPTATAIRTGNLYICNDFMNDPCTVPWRSQAERCGFRASASVCIKLSGEPIGALTIYAGEVDYFDPQVVELLTQMQDDISFALDNLERTARQGELQLVLQAEMVERLQAVEQLREREQMLVQQSRNAAMGEMIGNIAHQWRQPLNTLGLFTQRLGYFYGTPGFNKEFLDTSVAKSMEIIQYMSRTIDDFRNFFSTDREKKEFRVDEAADKALSLVEASFKESRINIEKDVRDDVVILGLLNEYAQVLLNILMNAKDAIVERMIEFPRVKVTIANEGGVSVVTIADNAGGIPEEIVDRIFDPYFTTKGPQQGTGVGLFMSKTIIENNMGGRLSVRNTAEGAEFRIEV